MSKLLVLDDTREQRDDMRRAALKAGFVDESIVEVASLEDARRQLDEPFDLAVVDIHLGDGLEDAGIDFIKELHKHQPRCKIIAFTTRRENLAGVRALGYGAVDFVSGRWQSVSWTVLLAEKLGIYKALIEAPELSMTSAKN
jgi:DNA-binding response OmpR family regulator